MLTNKPELVERVSMILNIETDEKNMKHLWNSFRDFPVKDRMRKLLKKFPNMPTLLIFSKEIEEETINGPRWFIEPLVYKNDYSIIFEARRTNRELIVFFDEDDYIYYRDNKIVEIKKGDNVSYVISTRSRMNPIAKEFEKHFGKLNYYKNLFENNQAFVERIDYLFSNLDTDINIIYDIMKPTKFDIFTFKLLNVLNFLKDPNPMFLRKFKGNPNERVKGIDPKFEVNTLLSYLKEFTEVKISLEDIYEEIEESFFDDKYIDYAASGHNPILTPEEEYERNPHA